MFSEFFDTNDPPLFTHFLRVDGTPDRVVIACHPAAGCVDDAGRDPEDTITLDLRTERWV